MTQAKSLVRTLIAVLVFLCGCDSPDGRPARLTSLSASEHKEVMDLLKQIYETGIGDHIVAWYETTTRGYFDVATGKMISFDEPVQTLSVAIPDFIAATTDVEGKLESVAKSASHNGWRLADFRVKLEPHGAGGGPSGSYDKVTIYPIMVAKAGRAVGQSREVPSTESGHDQRLNQPVRGDRGKSKRLACEILARNIRETGSKYEGLAKTLREVDGDDLVGCEM